MSQQNKGYIEVPYRLTEFAYKKLCMGCMELYEEKYKNCPRCGYIEEVSQKQQGSLENGTILNGQYILGRIVGHDATRVTYIGRHVLRKKKVFVKEYNFNTLDTKRQWCI